MCSKKNDEISDIRVTIERMYTNLYINLYDVVSEVNQSEKCVHRRQLSPLKRNDDNQKKEKNKIKNDDK